MSYETYFLSEKNAATDDEKADLEHAESDDRSILVINDNGVKSYQWDRGEPEDNCFGRDWDWVATELNKAYQAGLRDAAGES